MIFLKIHLATPLYFDTPLENPLLFLQAEKETLDTYSLLKHEKFYPLITLFKRVKYNTFLTRLGTLLL